MCSGRDSIFTGLAAIFVYFCFCSQQVPYCSLRVRHARMQYPVAIYTIPLLGQRLQIAPMLCIPFTLGLVTCHPPRGSSHRFMLFLPTLCPLHSTCCWCGLIFLIYRFETGFFNLNIYRSLQLIIIRQLRLLSEILPRIICSQLRHAPCHILTDFSLHFTPPVWPPASFPLKHTDCFDTSCLFYLKKAPNNSAWRVVFVCCYCCLLALDKGTLLFLFVLLPFHDKKQ